MNFRWGENEGVDIIIQKYGFVQDKKGYLAQKSRVMKSCFSVFGNNWYKAIQLKRVVNAHLLQIGVTLLVPL